MANEQKESQTVIGKIKTWYRGKFVLYGIYPLKPDSPIGMIIPPGYYKQPPLAKALRTIGGFWLNHWQWIIGICIALIALYYTIFKH